MSINVLINNGNLGRVGKTTLAYTLYSTATIPFKYATNDIGNASVNLKKLVDEEDLLNFPEGTEIEFDSDDNIIFDFGGKPDSRLLKVAQYVDTVVVPIRFESVAELKLTIRNVNAIKEVNSNIVIIINNTDTSKLELVKQAIAAQPNFEDMPVLLINKSEFVTRLANEEKTIFEVAEMKKAFRTQLEKKVLPQFRSVFEVLKIGCEK